MKKMNNKGFSLVELIVVIAIMAVLMGVLAPTLIGNIEKSRESKDLQNLDTVYNRVNDALGNDAVAREVASGYTTTTLQAILDDADSELGEDLRESIGANAPDLTANCNNVTNAAIYVEITTTNGNTQVRVFVATAANGNPTECTRTEDADGNPRLMQVPETSASAPTESSAS